MRDENLLLASLPDAERERLSPYLQPVTLDFQQVLIEQDREIEETYFPYDASCECLEIIEKEFETIFTFPPPKRMD